MRELWFDLRVVLSYVGVGVYVAVFILLLLGFFRTVDQYREAKDRGNAWMAEWMADYHAEGLKLGVKTIILMIGVMSGIAYVMRDDLFDFVQCFYWL